MGRGVIYKKLHTGMELKSFLMKKSQMSYNLCIKYFGLPISQLLVGLVVKASASRVEDPGFESRLRRDFFGVESYQ